MNGRWAYLVPSLTMSYTKLSEIGWLILNHRFRYDIVNQKLIPIRWFREVCW